MSHVWHIPSTKTWISLPVSIYTRTTDDADPRPPTKIPSGWNIDDRDLKDRPSEGASERNDGGRPSDGRSERTSGARTASLYLYWPVKPMLLPWNATVRVSRRPSICLLSNSTTMVRALSLSTHPPATTDVFLCFRASCAGPHPTCPTPLEFLENLKSSHVVVPPRSTTASFDGENLAVDGGLAPVFHVGS